MAAPKGSKNAQQHSEEHVISVLEDIIDGMCRFSQTQDKLKGEITETVSKSTTGYSCIERGLLANGHYSQKLCEWAETWKEHPVISELIKKARKVSADMIYINTLEGHYAPNVGIFMCKSKLGMEEKGVQDQNEATKKLVEISFVKPTE